MEVRKLTLWAQEVEAELALFDHWSEAERTELQDLQTWLQSQDWPALAADWEERGEEFEQIRKQALRLCADAWLALGPSQSPALNQLIWVLDNPEEQRQAQAVAASECILQQAREQSWEESELAELSDKLEQCTLALLTSTAPPPEVLDRLVTLLDRTTYADLTGPTRSRCWNSWIRLLESAPLEELTEPLERLDTDVESFARALGDSPLLVEYRRLSRAFRAHRASASPEDWAAEFESVLCELDGLTRARTDRARQLCQHFQLGAVTLNEYQQGLQDLKQSLQALGRSLAQRGDRAAAAAEGFALLTSGVESLEKIGTPVQISEMNQGCQTIERGLERLQVHG